MTFFQRLGLATLAFALMACSSMRAEAAFVTYTESVTASGSLGSTTFSNALVTLTFAGDTSTVIPSFQFFQTPPDTATVNVAGIGTATFTNSVYVYDNQSFGGTGYAGFGDSFVVQTIIATANDIFMTYDLQSSIGPISGTSFVHTDGTTFATSLGKLAFTSESGTSTFTAVVPNSVPEPSSLALCGMAALVGLCFARARGRLNGRQAVVA